KLLPVANPIIAITEGTVFSTLCSLSVGSEPLFFQWSKDGVKLPDSPTSSSKIETTRKLSYIQIDSVQRTDAGNYTCTLTNAFGSDSLSITLSIKGRTGSKPSI